MNEDQFTQILRAINDVRDDLKDFKKENKEEMTSMKEEIASMKEEITSIYKELDKINEKIEQRYKDTIKVFDCYEKSTESMYQENKQKIIAIQRKLKISNA